MVLAGVSFVAKKPFYNKAYASKYYWRGKAKRGGAGEGNSRGFSSASGSRRGGARVAVAAGARRERRGPEDMLEVPMYSNYGEHVVSLLLLLVLLSLAF